MDKTVPQDPTSDTASVPAQLRGETIAYAVQHCVYNLAANFFEPVINRHIQKRYSPGSFGSYNQNLLGEFAGDIVGSSTLILAEAFIPRQLHGFTRAARRWVDPLYTSVAHRVFAKDKHQPDYEQQVERWKTFQERNLIRSAIMVTAGVAGNVAAQKTLIGNPAPTSLIFKGKLLSLSLTTALALGVRFVFPDQTRRFDGWMGKKFFTPMLEDKGIEPAASHAERVSNPDGKSPEPAR